MAFGFLKAPFKALGKVGKFAIKRLPAVGAGFLLGGPAGAALGLAESLVPGSSGAAFDPRFQSGGQFSRNPFMSQQQRLAQIRQQQQANARAAAARAAAQRQRNAANQRALAAAEATRVRLERERAAEREREKRKEGLKNLLPIVLGVGGAATVAAVGAIAFAARRPALARR